MFGNELFVFLHRVAHWSKTLHIIVFFPFVQQGNFEFCETIPGFISGLLCAYVPLYPKFCSDVCESADDDDDNDDINATSLSMNIIMQQEERLHEMVVHGDWCTFSMLLLDKVINSDDLINLK